MTALEAKHLTSLFLGIDVNDFTLLDYKMRNLELNVKVKEKGGFVSTHIFGRKSSSSPSFEELIKPD
jgi:hypothetical protein